MALKRYRVDSEPGPEGAIRPFECEAGSAVEAIGKFERHLHARRRPRAERARWRDAPLREEARRERAP